MKIPLLLGIAALALAGCCTNKKNQGAVGTTAYTGTGASSGHIQYTLQDGTQDGTYGKAGYVAETTTGRSEGFENNMAMQDPRGFQNWRYGGDTDRIAPRLPVNPLIPTAPLPVIKLPPTD